MLVEAGEENAGLVDIGDGLACCFKIESHNHPSALNLIKVQLWSWNNRDIYNGSKANCST